MSRIKLARLVGKLNGFEQKFAPEVLFTAGNLSIMETRPRVSVIGSRAASEDGIKRAAVLTRRLIEYNAVIVSGLAEGIDCTAHRVAIESFGKTIGIIGTPINQFYPKKNETLQKEMMRNQLVLTQFPIGEAVKRHNFITRNRLMALISDATVIVEATDHSGTITQGWECIRIKRPLFILESAVKNPALTWPHKMLAFGAYVLTKNNLDKLIKILPQSGATVKYASRKPDCFGGQD